MNEQKKGENKFSLFDWLSLHPWVNYWFPVVFLCGLIFYLSNQPSLPQPEINIPFFDKLEHMMIYGVLGFFLRRAFFQSNKPILQQFPSLCAILFCILYGISDEYHQSFIPPREVSGYDALADGLGGILGQWIHSSNLIHRLTHYKYGKTNSN